MHGLKRFSWALFCASLLVGLSGFGIVSCQKVNKELTFESYGPMVEIEGRLASIVDDDDRLEIRLEDDPRLFKCIAPYPEKFHNRSQVLHHLKPGDKIWLEVEKSDLSKPPEKIEMWNWFEIYTLRSEETVWLDRQGYLDWDLENRQVGINLLTIVNVCALLWLVAILFPRLESPVAGVVKVTLGILWSAKGWLGAGILLICAAESGYECWLDHQVSESPLHKGTIIERGDVKRFLIMTRHVVQIQPDQSEAIVHADAYWSTPERVEFRWDGKVKSIYLREELGTPWKNLILLIAFAILAILLAWGLDWAMKQEGFWD